MTVQFIIETLKKFDPNFDEGKFSLAVSFSLKYYKSNNNKALKIAKILTSIYPDSDAVITTLLFFSTNHNNLETITAQHYSAEIVELLRDLNKSFKIYSGNYYNTQSKTFQLLLSLKQDIGIRILLIRFSYLLHKIIYSAKITYIEYYFIALEISEIYVPLLKAIRIEDIQTTLQDACFQILQPKLNKFISNILESQSLNRDLVVNEIINNLHNILSQINICYKIYGRIKTPYSIWKKTVYKSSEVNKLFDIIGIRIIAAKETECYKILSTIHNDYEVVLGRFKNFITFPKSNGYQSLHTVIVSSNQKIEVQICTQKMYNITRLGLASHLQYKMQALVSKNLNITYSILNNLILARLTQSIISIKQKVFNTISRWGFLRQYIVDIKQEVPSLDLLTKSTPWSELLPEATISQQHSAVWAAKLPARLLYTQGLVANVGLGNLGNISQDSTSLLYSNDSPNWNVNQRMRAQNVDICLPPANLLQFCKGNLKEQSSIAERFKAASYYILKPDIVNIVNSGEFGAQSDGANPICNRRAGSNFVTNFSSIDYIKPGTSIVVKAENIDKNSLPCSPQILGPAIYYIPTINIGLIEQEAAILGQRQNRDAENLDKDKSVCSHEILEPAIYSTPATNISYIPQENSISMRRKKRDVENIERDETNQREDPKQEDHVNAIVEPTLPNYNLVDELAVQAIVNSGEFGAQSDGANPICNRQAESNFVTNFSSIDYICEINFQEVKQATKMLYDPNSRYKFKEFVILYQGILDNLHRLYRYAAFYARDEMESLQETTFNSMKKLCNYCSLPKLNECVTLHVSKLKERYDCDSFEMLKEEGKIFLYHNTLYNMKIAYEYYDREHLQEFISKSIYNRMLCNMKMLDACRLFSQLEEGIEIILYATSDDGYSAEMDTVDDDIQQYIRITINTDTKDENIDSAPKSTFVPILNDDDDDDDDDDDAWHFSTRIEAFYRKPDNNDSVYSSFDTPDPKMNQPSVGSLGAELRNFFRTFPLPSLPNPPEYMQDMLPKYSDLSDTE